MEGTELIWLSSTLLTILREFHDGMKARLVIGGQESDPFEVLAGFKQGCVLAPVINYLFLVAVTLVFRTGLSTDGSIPFKNRLDGSIFNLWRLQAQTKVSADIVYELQYAHDAALPSHSPSDLQDGLNTLMESYHRAGLIINTKKTEILQPSSSSQQSFTVHGDTLNITQQFRLPTLAACFRLTLI